MQIIKIPYWTKTRHILVDENFNQICVTDSLLVVECWKRQYSI